ncbi:zinc finger, BED-type, Phospholipase-like, Homeodomain-like protein [Artemisia annua]|uniref:Zinc finger, BED-type, Phospholipase-like, Homeodomain-like protein n=1 Tax=Artemisia annua TaxID=35608 RepID=A0A2U1MJW6_ARTAN|nr:zinc finger, BED-type, Phospholipase-like, Homeodomain-like protein [Artemisia annua]
MPRNRASQKSSSNTADVGSTNEPTIVGVVPTSRSQDVWCHFDMIKYSDGSTKAHCKACNTMMKSDRNTSLRKHAKEHCLEPEPVFEKTEKWPPLLYSPKYPM